VHKKQQNVEKCRNKKPVEIAPSGFRLIAFRKQCCWLSKR